MVTYLGGSILITIFALGGSIVSYNLHSKTDYSAFVKNECSQMRIHKLINIEGQGKKLGSKRN
jgi:hypothetical protein